MRSFSALLLPGFQGKVCDLWVNAELDEEEVEDNLDPEPIPNGRLEGNLVNKRPEKFIARIIFEKSVLSSRFCLEKELVLRRITGCDSTES